MQRSRVTHLIPQASGVDSDNPRNLLLPKSSTVCASAFYDTALLTVLDSRFAHTPI